MKIEEAIRILDPDTTTEALAEYEYFGGLRGGKAKIVAYEEAVEVACTALRAQQNHAKMDRSRWKGCCICEKATYLDGDVCISGVCHVKLGCFDFCPNCGKPLTEEAWAELERRIGENDGTIHEKK